MHHILFHTIQSNVSQIDWNIYFTTLAQISATILGLFIALILYIITNYESFIQEKADSLKLSIEKLRSVLRSIEQTTLSPLNLESLLSSNCLAAILLDNKGNQPDYDAFKSIVEVQDIDFIYVDDENLHYKYIELVKKLSIEIENNELKKIEKQISQDKDKLEEMIYTKEFIENLHSAERRILECNNVIEEFLAEYNSKNNNLLKVKELIPYFTFFILILVIVPLILLPHANNVFYWNFSNLNLIDIGSKILQLVIASFFIVILIKTSKKAKRYLAKLLLTISRYTNSSDFQAYKSELQKYKEFYHFVSAKLRYHSKNK